MSSINSITVEKLARLIGTPKCPALIDVRNDDDFNSDPRLIPGSVRRPYDKSADWIAELQGNAEQSSQGKSAVIICHKGLKLSHGVAALLREAGIAAEVLEGGFVAWAERQAPLVPSTKLPPRNAQGRTVWVTRERPKIDRIACPWLIRRFVDPHALFLFVMPSEVEAVADKFGGVAFDIEGVFWSHRDDRCTFDVMIEEFGLTTPALRHLATIVRAADTARLDLAPEASGLLAISLGLSRLYADDLAQLKAGLMLYDALYRWTRDATGESHNWPTNKAKSVT